MERYAAAKARLFEGVGTPAPRVAVINAEDPASRKMIVAARRCSEVITFRANPSASPGKRAEFEAHDIALSAGGTSFRLQTPAQSFDVNSKLVGRVNVENLLGAITAATARGIALPEAIHIAATLKPVPGRFETVENALGVTVVVDYAHTDDALRNLIALARGVTSGRVITLFGCGGDRDRTKRPKMGRAAAQASDLVVLTSDNPRSENPMAIIEEALDGVRTTSTECIVEPDRAAAISIAIRAAKSGDIVLIAGKGHEKVQVLRDKTVPFDDVAVAAEILRELER
jgi:UDP-N-acetylmuramoyl-L-alanyl-D-glutamate--2,6-diaminopimelate ligase